MWSWTPHSNLSLRLGLRSHFVVQSWGRYGRGRGGWRDYWPAGLVVSVFRACVERCCDTSKSCFRLQLWHVAFQRPGSRHRAVSRLISRLCPQATTFEILSTAVVCPWTTETEPVFEHCWLAPEVRVLPGIIGIKLVNKVKSGVKTRRARTVGPFKGSNMKSFCPFTVTWLTCGAEVATAHQLLNIFNARRS